MTTLDFRVEWEPVDELVRAPELRTTWARLEIWVAGRCITFVEDLPTSSVRRSINVPLYPVAEWAAFNWWLLRFDGRQTRPPGQVERRNLRAAGDGFIWPNLVIVPVGDAVAVRWDAVPLTKRDSLRYLSSGRSWVDASALQRSLGALIQATIVRLKEYGISHTPLQEEWSRIESLDQEEVDFCEAAARFGLDPFSEGVDRAPSIARAFERLEPELRTDFFDAVQTEAIDDALAWIEDSLAQARRIEESPHPSFGLELVSSTVHQAVRPDAGSPPWAIGYEVARGLREALRMSALDRVGEDMPVSLRVVPADVPGLAGVGATPGRASWTRLAVRTGSQDARRFAAARALYHAAATDAPAPYLLTNASSTTQQIGRSFAAEFLAPAEGIRQLLRDNAAHVAEEELARAASHFGASAWIVGHQVQNQLQSG